MNDRKFSIIHGSNTITRRVRAIDERFYGRTARIFYVGQIKPEQLPAITNLLVEAAEESMPAHGADDLRAVHRHARIPRERAAEFWDKVFELTREFSALPRGGTTSYAFVAGLYLTDYPSLTEPTGQGSRTARRSSRQAPEELARRVTTVARDGDA